MNIDAHQHFWIYRQEDYGWMDGEKMAPLRKDHLPSDLWRAQEGTGMEGSIVVQARQSLEESRWLLKLADQEARIRGVVGWVDLRAEDADAQLARFADHPKFVGVRHVVQDEPDPRFLLGEAFRRGIGFLRRHQLTYDILIYPVQLPAALEFVPLFPEQPFVLDHLAKPPIAKQEWKPWADQIRQLSKNPNLLCKISGMVTEADWDHWIPDHFKPYLDTVVDAFGMDRLMIGSDWPVCRLAAEYDQVMALVRDYFDAFSTTEKAALFGGNAARFYGV